MHRLLALSFAAMALPALATVNVNTAQQSELERTKGLDRVKAKNIIEYRAQTGTVFTSLEDLEKVPGFDKAAVDRVASQVSFEGPAYVPPKAAAKPEKGEAKKRQ